MNAVRSIGALVIGSALIAPAAASAQNAPVAVPIVGSPAAQQPTMPSTPPTRPASPAVLPTGRPAPTAPSSTMPGPLPKPGVRTLELSVKNGTVALNAQNVTLREIFAEWQRQTGCQFVNAEKLPPTPLALQFPAGTPELAALDSVLRGLASSTTGYGYIVAPRAASAAGAASSCGAVYILPTSRPTIMAGYAPPASPVPAAPMASPDDEIPPVVPFPGMTPFRPAAGQVAPNQPQPTQPYQLVPVPAGSPQNTQSAPTGTSPAPTPNPGFGAVAPTAPGAGGLNAPPPQSQPQQPPSQTPNGR